MKHIYSILLLLIVNQTLYGQQASALNFDGVNDAIDCGNPSALDITGTSLTLEAIITLDGNGTIISKEQSSAAGYILRQDADGKISFFIGSSGTWYGVSTTMAISTGVKYHIAATYDGSNLKIYLDGVETANSPTTASITSSTSNLTIGDWPLGGRNINATIDDIRIWNVTRTIAEISANMSTDLTLPQTGLVAYYKFNQGVVNADNSSETTLLDATSNTLNGTLNNFALTGSTSNWTGIAVTSVPTTNFTTQIYTGDDKDLDDLQVTGTGIQWYAAASGGAVIPSTTLLTDGTTYYASQTIAGVESTERLAITVNRISDNTQTFSAGATVADLVSTPSTGATATWYTSANGGIALADTDALSVGTYYVEEITLETIESLSSGFSSPRGVAVQSDGKILIADSGNDAIKRMNADGTGIEILGSGFNEPWSISIQPDGKLLVADTNNHIIKRMNADGTGIEALGSGLFWPISVDVQTDGKILIADFGNEVIKRMNADGTGIETLGFGFNLPYDAVVQSDGKILIADAGNDAIKRMNADGTNIEILASGFSDLFGLDIQSDGKILAATNFTSNDIKRVSVDGTVIENLGSGFNSPSGVAVQTDGKILIADSGNNAIKRITVAYTSNRVAVVVEEQVTAVPTTIYPTQIYTGDDKDLDDLQVTGTGIQWYAAATGNTTLSNTTLLADGTTYYASQSIDGLESIARLAITVNRISDNTQQYNAGDTVADLVSTPSTGTTATWYTTAIDGTALTDADVLSAGTYYVEEITLETIETLGSGFSSPFEVAVESNGKILILDTGNNAIKRMNADGTGIETLGSGFSSPTGVAVQSNGEILIADVFNNLIKRMNADGTGIETLGSGFNVPTGVAVQSNGEILIADTYNHAIKRMNADGTDIVTLGSGFNRPRGVAVQSDGTILVADGGNNSIKRMNADGTNIVTLGSGFNDPYRVAVQPDGKILVADTNNSAIKRMNADGTDIVTLGSDFNFPRGGAVEFNGKILVADTNNNFIKRFTEAYTSNRV
uniref:LamG-like jellyroll fold domain-containing protein n=1 Tax=Kordia sp. TaxID=1965332 RepID=UPI003D6A70B5